MSIFRSIDRSDGTYHPETCEPRHRDLMTFVYERYGINTPSTWLKDFAVRITYSAKEVLNGAPQVDWNENARAMVLCAGIFLSEYLNEARKSGHDANAGFTPLAGPVAITDTRTPLLEIIADTVADMHEYLVKHAPEVLKTRSYYDGDKIKECNPRENPAMTLMTIFRNVPRRHVSDSVIVVSHPRRVPGGVSDDKTLTYPAAIVLLLLYWFATNTGPNYEPGSDQAFPYNMELGKRAKMYNQKLAERISELRLENNDANNKPQYPLSESFCAEILNQDTLLTSMEFALVGAQFPHMDIESDATLSRLFVSYLSDVRMSFNRLGDTHTRSDLTDFGHQGRNISAAYGGVYTMMYQSFEKCLSLSGLVFPSTPAGCPSIPSLLQLHLIGTRIMFPHAKI